MTGVDADVHGVNLNFAAIPSQYKTLAEYLREAGYLTVAIGRHPQLLRMHRGFSIFDFYPKQYPWHGDTSSGKLLFNIFDRDFPTHVMTNAVCDWLERNLERDFLLWVHFLEPHTPYTPPESFLPKDDPIIRELGRTFAARARTHDSVHAGRAVRSPREKRWIRSLYDAGVRYTDHEIGRILDKMKHLEIYEETLVIFTADHGEEFWEHGGWEHGHSLYHELVATPLVLKLPGSAVVRKIDAAVSNVSVLPTLLDIAGVPHAPDSLTAPSLLPLWAGGVNEPEGPVFLGGVEYFEPRVGVIFDDFKLVKSLVSDDVELYDLGRDPKEGHSIVDEYPAKLQEGLALLSQRQPLKEAFRARDLGPPKDRLPLNERLKNELSSLGYVQNE